MALLNELDTTELATESRKQQDLEIKGSTACQFITGAAGTGKTYSIKNKVEDPEYVSATGRKFGVLAATTGIAAVNLGATTLNSLLKYFDTASMATNMYRIKKTLAGIAKRSENLIIDEVSMMDSKQLDLLYGGLDSINSELALDERLGLILLGDFCQLGPIKAKYAFQANCWDRFEKNTTKLTKVWRQTDVEFLTAINLARSGNGAECAEVLRKIGIEFSQVRDGNFPGTTIIPRNEDVDNFNRARLDDVPGKEMGLNSEYWGEENKEWRKNIPAQLRVKVGAYVMILNNDSPVFTYVNGDCGYLREIDASGKVWIELARNGEMVAIEPIIRSHTITEKDAKDKGLTKGGLTHVWCHPKDCGANGIVKQAPWKEVSYNCSSGTFNTGGVRYYPLRMAWATTVYKSQGLSLDQVQIDPRDQFFGSPGQAYVALSRARTPQGLRICNTPEKFALRVAINPAVKRFV